jgi:hypothetical protein
MTKLIKWTPPQNTTLGHCHSTLQRPVPFPLARSPCPCHCNAVCLFASSCVLLTDCHPHQGAEWGFESHVRTPVIGNPVRETLIPVRCSCEHPVMGFALLKSWSETPSYIPISRPTDATCDRFLIFYLYVYNSTCFERQALVIRRPSPYIRGLLEKYPTFGREKETGLLGALDT